MAHGSFLARLENFLTEWPRSEPKRPAEGAPVDAVRSRETSPRPEVPIR